MTYNFKDEPTPVLSSHVDSTGNLILVDGTPQGDFITDEFSGSTVTVTIAPPRGWNLDSVTWTEGGSGTFSVPEPDVEETHPFVYSVSQNGTSKTGAGHFKIKKQGDGGNSGG